MPEIAHAERAHALLSASSAKQWLNCTPSARLSEQFPDTHSTFAAEGTLAHEMSELKLRAAFVEPMPKRTFNAQLKKFKEHELYQPEMDKHTDTYVEYIAAIVHQFATPPYVAVERRLDYSAYAPEGFGTGDCIIIGGGTLYINDLKYGKGVPVSAEGNPQMRLYALGAYLLYSLLHKIDRVQMAIIQPRLDSISEETLTLEELLEWGDSIRPLAKLAWEGKGEFQPGDHCKFCRARATCAARAEYHLSLEGFHAMKPPLISAADVGQILERARNLASWVKDLEDYALQEALTGAEIPGWKAVEGRGSRQYRDLDEAFQALIKSGIEEAMLYERKPLTVPNVEKLLGKQRYRELLEPYVVNQPGKPTLVPETDKRQATTRDTAADDFAPVTEN
ncbi:DUF2800 domain-containing protein [Alicyclobacillus sp. ALC3]|uniref:DUF2800 domain-containing protein n=1 Tax=Alicyclobacillus sp. ALC3 TaxID=2796143 RepID=UPI0023790352|nr:DUF2800 domain-containing protein [Alicyclobacillus sp. ALC3]WDL96904.1 DUF2800 domain-containing protein [Alicyclobacillus sp. ALC3]